MELNPAPDQSLEKFRPQDTLRPQPSLNLGPDLTSQIMALSKTDRDGAATELVYDRGPDLLVHGSHSARQPRDELGNPQLLKAFEEGESIPGAAHIPIGAVAIVSNMSEGEGAEGVSPKAGDHDAADAPEPVPDAPGGGAPPGPPKPPADAAAMPPDPPDPDRGSEGEPEISYEIERDIFAYMKGEAATERSLEEESLHMSRLNIVREKADELLATQGAEQPQLLDDARQRAEEVSANVIAVLQGDEPVPPETVETLQTAFTRLHVAFTPDDETLAQLVAEVSPEVVDNPPTVQEVATYLDNLASHMTVVREGMGTRGELVGMSPAAQLAHVKGRLELIFLPGIEDDLADLQQIETAEAPQSPENPILQQFDRLLDLAQANPENTWVKPVRDEQGNITSVQIWELSHIDPVIWPAWGTFYDYHYDIRNPMDPDDVQHAYNRRRSPVDSHPQTDGGNPTILTVPQLCSDFIFNAADPEHLGKFMEAYADWAQNNTDQKPMETLHVMRRLVSSSLLMEGNPLADPDSRVVRALATIRPDEAANYSKVSANASDVIGKMLMSETPQGSVPRLPNAGYPLEHYRDKLFDIADQLYDIGLLKQSFWFERGVQAGGVFTVPGMLERTHDNLQSDEGVAVLASQEVASVESTVRDYVGNLLRHFAQDEHRDQDSFQRILLPRPRGITNTYGSPGLSQLIATANGVTTRLNEALTQKGTPADRLLPRLDQSNPGHLGEALIRISRYLRLPNLPQDVRQLQEEQEAIHASIIEQVQTNLRDRRMISIADLKLRYPQATDDEIQQMLGGFRRGTPSTRVDAWFRSKRGGVSGWKIRGEGYGKLS